ncbi:MAG: synaptobrevin-B [Lachnospira sp.]|nr:synaptobrevin-B [Lachnospira sp.]
MINFNDRKNRRIFASVIAIILVLSMVLAMAVPYM